MQDKGSGQKQKQTSAGERQHQRKKVESNPRPLEENACVLLEEDPGWRRWQTK